jgi:hypothetical protein
MAVGLAFISKHSSIFSASASEFIPSYRSLTRPSQTLAIRALIAQFNSTPIKGLSLSASGLLALADLQTIAQRTAITGTSSWLDSFVLAPGLHYQQAADSLLKEPTEPLAVEHHGDGQIHEFAVANVATVNYMQRLAAHTRGSMVTLDVGLRPPSMGIMSGGRGRRGRRRRQRERDVFPDEGVDMDWVSHLLYLASPVFTVAAMTFMILFEDCKSSFPSLSSATRSHPTY